MTAPEMSEHGDYVSLSIHICALRLRVTCLYLEGIDLRVTALESSTGCFLRLLPSLLRSIDIVRNRPRLIVLEERD